MESPSSWIGQFHKKKASRVPRSPGFNFGTIEWSCPGIVMLVKSENKNCLIQKGKTLAQRNTSEDFWSSD